LQDDGVFTKVMILMSKMRENSATSICVSKTFSGVIPPDPRFKGREGRGE